MVEHKLHKGIVLFFLNHFHNSPKKPKKERHRLRMPSNVSSKDYEGIRAQTVQKIKKKQKFRKKQKQIAKTNKVPDKKDPQTFKKPPKGTNRGENARFRLSLKKNKNKS